MPVVRTLDPIYPGEDIELGDTIYQSDGVTPEDITGWSIQFTVHKLGTTYITKTTGDGITLTDPENGILTVAIDGTDTEDMTPYNYEFCIERTDPGGAGVLTTGTIPLFSK